MLAQVFRCTIRQKMNRSKGCWLLLLLCSAAMAGDRNRQQAIELLTQAANSVKLSPTESRAIELGGKAQFTMRRGQKIAGEWVLLAAGTGWKRIVISTPNYRDELWTRGESKFVRPNNDQMTPL